MVSAVVSGAARQTLRAVCAGSGPLSAPSVARSARCIAAVRRSQTAPIQSRAYSRTPIWRQDWKVDDPVAENEPSTEPAPVDDASPVTTDSADTSSAAEAGKETTPELTLEQSPTTASSVADDAATDAPVAAKPAEAGTPAPPSKPAPPRKQFPAAIALLAPELQEIFTLIPQEDREPLLREAGQHLQTLPIGEQARLADEASKLQTRLIDRFGADAADSNTVLEPSAKATALMNTFLAHLRPPRTRGLFALDEVDADVIGNDEPFENDDISPLAHAELEQQREIRQYSRWIVWELPLLTEHAREFTPPTKSQILRFRYTRVLGEAHPSDRKVVLEFCVSDLEPILPAKQQRDKLIKLVGPRYNPDTDIVRMSCDSYSTPAQNKRRLALLVQRLLDEVKDPNSDTFADVPMDFRHHKPRKTRAQFPTEWIMTPERRRELDSKRQVKAAEA